jgi:integrase
VLPEDRGVQPTSGSIPNDRGTCQPVTPAHDRGYDDPQVRAANQEVYIRAIKGFSAFFGASPDKASFEDLRRYQLHLVASGTGTPTINHTVTALRFLFIVTLRKPQVVIRLPFIREPRKLPIVLSPEEVVRLLDAAPGLKYKAALSVAYGAGLRASEVVSLKVEDIDSTRMVIRVEQGKGRKDRYVMLSQYLLDLLRAWWRAARPRGWLFPGRDRVQPLTTCQHNRARHAAAMVAEIDKPVSLHTLRHQLCHSPARAEDRHPRHSGAARAQKARYDGALHPCRFEGARRDHQSARSARPDDEAARVSRGAVVPSRAGGRAHFPQSRTGMADRQCRPCEPWPVQSHVSH